jgi:hypothetical protein
MWVKFIRLICSAVVLLAKLLLAFSRGCSSAGRASVLHAEGQRFDSAHLHHTSLKLRMAACSS